MVKTKKLQGKIHGHLKSNIGLYFLVLVFFAIGVAAGAFTVRALSDIQKESLLKYLQVFFQILTSSDVDSMSVLKQSIKNNGQTVFALWLFGIAVIGIPLTLLILGLRGFIVGFTVGFLIDNMGTKGLVFTLLAILPQNLVIIPCLLAVSVISIRYSIMIIREKRSRNKVNNYWQKFFSYSIIIFILMLIIVGGSFIEAYITPAFIKLISSYMLS